MSDCAMPGSVATELFNVGNHSVLKVMPTLASEALLSGKGLATLAAVGLGCAALVAWGAVGGPSPDADADPPAALLRACG